jgi:hypothetical protein
LLASPKNIGVHKSDPEYASTINIPTTPPFSYSWCSNFHLIQRKIGVWFLLKYLQNPLVILKIKRRGWKKIERKEKVLRKREKKKRSPKVSHDKGMNILREEKNI